MSPFATGLKAGTTALVLEALVRDPRRSLPQLWDPLEALKSISRDPAFRWEIRLQEDKPATGLEIQRLYLNVVRQVCDLSSRAKAALVTAWENVLNDLERDIFLCRNRLDWVAKLALVREFQASQNLRDDDPWLRSLDLEYHRLDVAEGLYYGLEQTNAMLGSPEEAAVWHAVSQPPKTTRAYVRGRCIQKFAALVVAAQWDHITLQGSNGPIKISLLDLFAPEDILRYGSAIDAASTPDDLRMLNTL
jgi:proteasome accessory factor A